MRPSFRCLEVDVGADEAGVVCGRPPFLNLALAAHLWMDDVALVGVLHKWGGDRFKLPYASGPVQAENIDAVLEGVNLLLLRLLIPVKDPA